VLLDADDDEHAVNPAATSTTAPRAPMALNVLDEAIMFIPP
jgi:hypothetical protein